MRVMLNLTVIFAFAVFSQCWAAAVDFQTFVCPAKDEKTQCERKYLLHLPASLKVNAPLLFVLHGYRGDARDYMGEMGMNSQAQRHGFAVCYPQGSDDVEGVAHWNARLKISETDDVYFLSQLALALHEKYGLNPKKTFVCGVSNGGFMSYTLVAEKPDVFKAAASVIGTMSGATWESRARCKAVPVLQMSGLHDEVVPHDGSMSTRGGWGGAPSQDEVIKFWAGLANATEEEVVELTPKTTVRYFRGGRNGIEVWFYQVKKMGHAIPNMNNSGIDVSKELWRFFRRF